MKPIKYLLLSCVAILFIACQKDELLIIQDSTQNLSYNSPLTNLLSRVAQSATSKDNVLDNSSCFSIHLPVVVIVDGKQIIVSNENDYKTVQSVLDAFSDDDDEIDFVYPITIQLKNFNTQQILNSDQLAEVISNCNEDNEDDFDEIDCVDINYPIKISVYNANNQIANTVAIQNDRDLFNALKNFGSNVFIAINYPISVTNSNSQNVIIVNNLEFEAIIESSIKDCGSNSGGAGNANFVSVLTNGIWQVSYFFKSTDETISYKIYKFSFNPNGSITVSDGSSNSAGDWSGFVNNGQEGLELDFDNNKLDKLERDWKILEYTSTSIRLKNEDEYLSFTKK
ncbi:hypothetical protein SAMN05443667_11190 [Flavobacterium gillisiae]|uniref:Lipoprotein n=1 Tax=Flavobacterium gillisiae TaxID=150146 RepID=A0A1H4EZ39_9FLAO|nr:hypothetical protein [Flavobacterium gillisiae]SEA90296.1 hypothetical protein SAMN05443667_11190 [Flavobacterium gillisiae]